MPGRAARGAARRAPRHRRHLAPRPRGRAGSARRAATPGRRGRAGDRDHRPQHRMERAFRPRLAARRDRGRERRGAAARRRRRAAARLRRPAGAARSQRAAPGGVRARGARRSPRRRTRTRQRRPADRHRDRPRRIRPPRRGADRRRRRGDAPPRSDRHRQLDPRQRLDRRPRQMVGRALGGAGGVRLRARSAAMGLRRRQPQRRADVRAAERERRGREHRAIPGAARAPPALDHRRRARRRIRRIRRSAARGAAAMKRDHARLAILAHAAALALGPAVSLGLARFAYALLLPPMRADLGWSYFTAGAMNTVNAAGYLLGAIAMPRAMARGATRAAFTAGGVATALLLAAHGLVRADVALYALRLVSGVASAATFVGGGLLAAQLASRGAAAGVGAGLVLGLYYGGTGVGIIASALLVPAFGDAWQDAWIALGALALALTALMAWGAGHAAATATGGGAGLRGARGLGWGLAAYFLFGLGYIGYMTFIVTLLREQHLPGAAIVGFFALLGAGVVASSWIWAGVLQRHRDGRALALLNALLAAATLLPLLWTHPLAAFASGLLFGGVFLSVVASTTALVRHNLPPAAWGAGIGAFTIVFAAGQIVGPGLVGALSDAFGGLKPGLAVSAAVLALGAALGLRQRALPRHGDAPA